MRLRKLFSLFLAGLVLSLVGVTSILVARSTRGQPPSSPTSAPAGTPLLPTAAPTELPSQPSAAPTGLPPVPTVVETPAALLGCKTPGWAPSAFGLKDHSVFWYQGYYYLVSIRLPDDSQFAYGRSVDLCNWETLANVLPERKPGSWDEAVIWAPYVYQEGGIFYMYYTGVNRAASQSVLLATSTNPADPASWISQPMVFQPNHTGTAWKPDAWGDCRDPMVVKSGEHYFLFYTGRDLGGGMIGLATATTPTGPWTDWGPVFPPVPDVMLESPTLVEFSGASYLFYHRVGVGEFYRTASSLIGLWGAPRPLAPGWAHEVWQTTDGAWLTSYLTDSSVTIAPLTWDTASQPARALVGPRLYRGFLPFLGR
jgi:predicted GH43/DUF377 family glycosyl hydrolase